MEPVEPTRQRIDPEEVLAGLVRVEDRGPEHPREDRSRGGTPATVISDNVARPEQAVSLGHRVEAVTSNDGLPQCGVMSIATWVAKPTPNEATGRLRHSGAGDARRRGRGW